jgi:CRISPR-associated protein Csb2
MNLVLEIECLTGVYRAAKGPASELPDWPPQPDRVFSALVSAWAARGERGDERVALEWLEAQRAPTVRASGHFARTAPDVFVPPNDLKASKAEKTYLKVMPDRRPRQPRRFPAARPDDPVLALIWEKKPEAALCEALDAVARDVGYLGHSTSLVRCRFRYGNSDTYPHPEVPVRRRVYPGRLSELEAAHRADPIRPDIPPGASVSEVASAQPLASSSDWLVLEAIDDVPDIRAAALVCRTLRRTLMSGYRRAELGEAIPEVVSGHTADRTPSRNAHLAIVPLAFAGFPHADGRVFGFALVPPAGTKLLDVPGLGRAFERIAPYDDGRERRVVKLKGPPLLAPLRLVPAGATTVRSLSPEPYLLSARVWASVTPIVIDRHLKQNGDSEIRGILADACEHAGLPRPDPDRIRTGKHSAVEGAPPARPSVGAPPWTRWKVPESLSTRSLVHAIIDFGQETCGPVLLGAGRFTGLGLCRRLER